MDAMMTETDSVICDGTDAAKQANTAKNAGCNSLHLAAPRPGWGNKANTTAEDNAADSRHNAADDGCQNLGLKS